MRRWLTCLLILCNPLFAVADERCLLADLPPPPVLSADLPRVTLELKKMISFSPSAEEALGVVFSAKTKLEQFFQLLFWIQNQVSEELPPLSARPPGITNVLLAARVFKDPSFPEKIQLVTLSEDDSQKPPRYRVEFSGPEVRFPLNGGVGFAIWDQKMCQIAKELVFYN
mgnify:CR=1 FL=1